MFCEKCFQTPLWKIFELIPRQVCIRSENGDTLPTQCSDFSSTHRVSVQSMCVSQLWAYCQGSCWTVVYDIFPVLDYWCPEGICFFILGLSSIPAFFLPSAVLLVRLSPLMFSLLSITTYGDFWFVVIRRAEDNSLSLYTVCLLGIPFELYNTVSNSEVFLLE